MLEAALFVITLLSLGFGLVAFGYCLQIRRELASLQATLRSSSDSLQVYTKQVLDSNAIVIRDIVAINTRLNAFQSELAMNSYLAAIPSQSLPNA